MQPAALHRWQLNPGATVALEAYRLCNAILLVHACKQSVQKSSSQWKEQIIIIIIIIIIEKEDSQPVSQAATYIIPFHKFVALSQALGDGHRLELQRMNSRLCPCHWLMYSSRRTAAAEMSHFTLFISRPLLLVICLKAGWRKPHYCCQYVMPALTAAVARLGFGELWKADAGAANRGH